MRGANGQLLTPAWPLCALQPVVQHCSRVIEHVTPQQLLPPAEPRPPPLTPPPPPVLAGADRMAGQTGKLEVNLLQGLKLRDTQTFGELCGRLRAGRPLHEHGEAL